MNSNNSHPVDLWPILISYTNNVPIQSNGYGYSLYKMKYMSTTCDLVLSSFLDTEMVTIFL